MIVNLNKFLIKENVIGNLDSDVISMDLFVLILINLNQISKMGKKPKEIKVNDNDVILLFVGRLNKDKGVFDLLRAFNSLTKTFKNIKLLMVGSDENFVEFLNKITQLKIKL